VTSIAEILATLIDVRDYLDDHSDADHNGVYYVPNKAMQLIVELDDAIAKLRRLRVSVGDPQWKN
jgi:hypothetical protein